MDSQQRYKNVISEIPSTAVDIYRILPEGTRCEVIFNELIMSPAPSREHQTLLMRLTVLLFQYMDEHSIGNLYAAPFDVYFEGIESVVQPDLFVVLNDDMDIVQKNGVHGVPSSIIEVVSTNRAYDTQRKRSLYEKAGVKEYFLIDPENKKITLLTLNTSGFYEQTYEATGQLCSAILNCQILF
jgi:Uma2 family endonuclease